MDEIKALEIVSIDDKLGMISVKCNDGKIRKLDINRMFQDDIPIGMQETWKCMFKSGSFGKAYILTGDIVWGGWCEILSGKEMEMYMEVVAYVAG